MNTPRPHTERPAAFESWKSRIEATGFRFRVGEDAVAFAAFIAGWHLRAGEDPDDPATPTRKREFRVCGVTCHPSGEHCNGYCRGDSPAPAAIAPDNLPAEPAGAEPAGKGTIRAD